MCGINSCEVGCPNGLIADKEREKEISSRERERDTYTINCVDERQQQKEVTSANAIIDSGVACSKPKD
jgi:hypothetical protein